MTRAIAFIVCLTAALSPSVSHGQITGQQEISLTEGNLGSASLFVADYFGASVASVGDIDRDGTLDLLVGAEGDDDGGRDIGSARLLFLNADGTVKSSVKVGASQLPSGALNAGDYFGSSVAGLQDLNGDGFRDIAVGARGDDDGSAGFEESTGAVWILFLDASGAVIDSRKISEIESGFGGDLDRGDVFGRSLSFLGDLGEDGTKEIAVGAPGDDDGGPDRGALWIVSLNPDGSVAGQTKISDGNGLGSGQLSDFDGFGTSSARIANIEGGGAMIVVGSPFADPAGANSGEFWFIDLDPGSDVASAQTASLVVQTGSEWSSGGLLGRSLAGTGDLNDNGSDDLLVALPGAASADEGGEFWFMDLQPGTLAEQLDRISSTSGVVGPLGEGDRFGQSMATLGDLDGDGKTDYAVGAPYGDDGVDDSGSVYVLFGNRATPVGFAVDLPRSDVFAAPYPNPAHNEAVFQIRLGAEQNIRIEVFDVTGRRVATVIDGRLSPGTRHELPVDISDWPSGTYIYRVTGDGTVREDSFVVLR